MCAVLGLVLPPGVLVAGLLAGVPGGPPGPGVSLMALLLKNILVKPGEGIKPLPVLLVCYF